MKENHQSRSYSPPPPPQQQAHHQPRLPPPIPPQRNIQEQDQHHHSHSHSQYHPTSHHHRQYQPRVLHNPHRQTTQGGSRNHSYNGYFLNRSRAFDYPTPPPPSPSRPSNSFIVSPPRSSYSRLLVQESYSPATYFHTNNYSYSYTSIQTYLVHRTRQYEEENQRLRIEYSGGNGADWNLQFPVDASSRISIRVNVQEEIALIDLPPSGVVSYSEELVGSNSNVNNLSEEFILEHLKTRKYQTPAKQVGEQEPEICVVCQSEYENGEMVGTLGCGHQFHADCIKNWLLRKNDCPICKGIAIQQGS